MTTWKRWFKGSKAITIEGQVRWLTFDDYLNLTLATQNGKNHNRKVGKVVEEFEFTWCGSATLHERVSLVKYGHFMYAVVEKTHQDQAYIVRSSTELFAARIARYRAENNFTTVEITRRPCQCFNCQAGKFSGETYSGIA